MASRAASESPVIRAGGIPWKPASAHSIPISPTNRFFNPDLAHRAYDPDKAKFYLKKAGLSSLKVNLSSADAAFPGAVDAAVLYKEHAAKAGIDITVVREPNDGYWSDVWMKKPWVMSYWGPRLTEDLILAAGYHGDANWNDTRLKIPRLDKLIVGARAELDKAKRHAMYSEVQEILHNEGATVVFAFANFIIGFSDKVKHGENISSHWDLDGGSAIERWWFA